MLCRKKRGCGRGSATSNSLTEKVMCSQKLKEDDVVSPANIWEEKVI